MESVPTPKSGVINIANIPLYIHWSFWLVLLYIGAAGGLHSSNPFVNMTLFVLLMTIVTLHEFGHALTARALGIRVDKISITGIGGIAELGDFRDAQKEFLVTLGGPLVNVAVAILLWPLTTWGTERTLLDSLWLLNLVVLIFNLLPVYPMDGGRLFRIALHALWGEERSYTISKYLNLCLLGVAIVVCLQSESYVMLLLLGFMGLYGVGTCRTMEEIIGLQKSGDEKLCQLFSQLIETRAKIYTMGKGSLSDHHYEYSMECQANGSVVLRVNGAFGKSYDETVACNYDQVAKRLHWQPQYVVYLPYLQACTAVMEDCLFSPCSRQSNIPTSQANTIIPAQAQPLPDQPLSPR